MEKEFVKVTFDVYCESRGKNPVYRVYVNDELFTERSWVFSDTQYLREMLQISAPPGEYNIEIDNLGREANQFKIRNLSAEFGPVTIVNRRKFAINNENT
jgi:hypothetical protein